MSGPDQEISSSSGGGVNEDEDGVVNPSRKDGVKEGIGGKTEDESKRVFVFRFGKAKKTLQLLRRKRRKKKQKKGGGGLVNSGGCFGGWGGGGMVGCCLCGKQTAALDSSGESPSSDPNSKEFTFDMLRVLIENNDFYAVECNPHLDCSLDKT